MIHVLLDSSIYRNDPSRRRLAFKTLAGLCEKKLVTLHVPSIVKREFTTYLAVQAEAVLGEAVRSLKKLTRSDGPNSARILAETSLTELRTFTTRYGEHAVSSFNEWLQKVHAVEHEVKPECVHDVLDRYFEGELPFKTVKSRDDFPDAFIWQIIRELAGKGRLCAVIADKNFRKAVSKIEKVDAFESLEAFIEAPAVQDLFPENFVRKHEVEILNLFKYSPWIFDVPIADGIDSELRDTSIAHTVYENFDEADIVDVESVDNVTIDFGRAHYFGDNIFRLPFKARVRAILDYFLDKSTYYGMSNEETLLIEVQDSEWNDSTMWVQEGRYLNVEGELGIALDMTELIRKSGEGRLDTDTVLYGSEITIDQIQRTEIVDV